MATTGARCISWISLAGEGQGGEGKDGAKWNNNATKRTLGVVMTVDHCWIE
jgi:hypothetical protein